MGWAEWSGKEWGMAKRHGETFEGNGYVHCLDCGYGSMGVYKVKSCPISHFNICILSYINYISIKQKTKWSIHLTSSSDCSSICLPLLHFSGPSNGYTLELAITWNSTHSGISNLTPSFYSHNLLFQLTHFLILKISNFQSLQSLGPMIQTFCNFSNFVIMLNNSLHNPMWGHRYSVKTPHWTLCIWWHYYLFWDLIYFLWKLKSIVHYFHHFYYFHISWVLFYSKISYP